MYRESVILSTSIHVSSTLSVEDAVVALVNDKLHYTCRQDSFRNNQGLHKKLRSILCETYYSILDRVL